MLQLPVCAGVLDLGTVIYGAGGDGFSLSIVVVHELIVDSFSSSN